MGVYITRIVHQLFQPKPYKVNEKINYITIVNKNSHLNSQSLKLIYESLNTNSNLKLILDFI